jgi:hypothetical protein
MLTSVAASDWVAAAHPDLHSKLLGRHSKLSVLPHKAQAPSPMPPPLEPSLRTTPPAVVADPHHLVGRRIGVWWAGDRELYHSTGQEAVCPVHMQGLASGLLAAHPRWQLGSTEGRQTCRLLCAVLGFDTERQTHDIQYDDGVQEALNLRMEHWVLLDQQPQQKESQPQQQQQQQQLQQAQSQQEQDVAWGRPASSLSSLRWPGPGPDGSAASVQKGASTDVHELAAYEAGLLAAAEQSVLGLMTDRPLGDQAPEEDTLQGSHLAS